MSFTGVIEGCAGPGGWSTGLRMAGYTGRAAGIEWDLAACQTATAAGHERICADVATYPAQKFTGAEGVIFSPPCQAWSQSGKHLGLADQPRIHHHLARVTNAGHWVDYPRTGWADDRSPLVLEPVRWIGTITPEWFALEQVETVLPFWHETARWARTRGYHTWCGVLSAEEFGVPQTRRRAILLGRLSAPVQPPAATHQAYRPGEPATELHDLYGGIRKPWVSMYDAIGWGLKDRPAWTVTAGGVEQGGVEVFGNARSRARLRQAVGGGSIKVTVEDAAKLQSFPDDYPWHGTVGQRHQQVGNAVPPLLAAAVLRPLLASTVERAA